MWLIQGLLVVFFLGILGRQRCCFHFKITAKLASSFLSGNFWWICLSRGHQAGNGYSIGYREATAEHRRLGVK